MFYRDTFLPSLPIRFPKDTFAATTICRIYYHVWLETSQMTKLTIRRQYFYVEHACEKNRQGKPW